MKIASFNVNGLRARLPIVVDWLSKHKPDILCVQETKVQDEDFPGEAIDETGYKYVCAGQKSYNGVAIFSKKKLSKTQAGFDDEPKDKSRLLKTEIDGIIIVNTYIPQGYSPESEMFQYKLKWFEHLRGYFKKNFKRTDPIVWLGDFNVAPEDIDVYDPVGFLGHVCFNPDVKKALKKVCQWSFEDLFRKHCKEASQYTFWDYRERNSFSRNLGWRLDHIMATESLAKKCKACYIDKEPRTAERPSDHTPIVAEFEI
jgi:exodeoxyribonuclease III